MIDIKELVSNKLRENKIWIAELKVDYNKISFWLSGDLTFDNLLKLSNVFQTNSIEYEPQTLTFLFGSTTEYKIDGHKYILRNWKC